MVMEKQELEIEQEQRNLKAAQEREKKELCNDPAPVPDAGDQ
jgi:hypothetical protein